MNQALAEMIGGCFVLSILRGFREDCKNPVSGYRIVAMLLLMILKLWRTVGMMVCNFLLAVQSIQSGIRDSTALDAAEFLSGFHKDDKLIPVITAVVYFGADEWDAPMSIHEMRNAGCGR